MSKKAAKFKMPTNRKLVFARKINGEDLTGVVDIVPNPPVLMCVCNQAKSEEIIEWYKLYVGVIKATRP